MFYIGFVAGALLVFILLMIYSSIVVSSRADKQIRARDWNFYQEELEEESEMEEYDALL